MGAKLSDFLSDATTTGAPLRIPSKGIKLPKSNYIGLAMVPKNLLPDIGSATTFTPPGGGTATAITTANLVEVLKSLALNGQARVFGNGVINGKRGPFKADEESMIFGSRRMKRDSGEGEIAYTFMFKYAYHNTAFLNQLRLGYEEYDHYAFTDKSVEVLRYDQVEPVYKNVKNGEVTGNNTDELSNGGFDIVIGPEGEIDPDFGSFEKLIQISNFKYSFGVPVATGTGLAVTLGGTVVTKTAPGTGTIANPVLETIGAGVVVYSIAKEDGSAPPTGVTIDTATGVWTIAASVTAGTYNLRVAVENKTGVMGEYRAKLIAA